MRITSSSLLVALAGMLVAMSVCAQPESHYGAWGFDLTAIDAKAAPGDGFFRHANGAWIDRATIPSDRGLASLRLLMTETTIERIRAILEQAAQKAQHEPADVEGKAGAFYKAFMDEAHLESLGTKPLEGLLSEIRSASDRNALAALMGRAGFDFLAGLFAISISVDARDPARYAVTINQSGLGLPNREYYLSDGNAQIKARYRRHIERLLELVGWPEAGTNADKVLRLEERIARVSWPDAAARDAIKTYNVMTVAELGRFAPGFGWRPFLAAARVGTVKRLVVAEKSAFPKLAATFRETPVATLQAWAAFRAVSAAGPFLSRTFADESFDMFGRTILGKSQEMDRWKRGVYAAAGGIDASDDDGFGTIRWVVGELYVTRHFRPESMDHIEAIVANLRIAFRERIGRVNWMESKTKKEALRKLDRLKVRIGGPTKQRDHTDLRILDADLFGNVRRAAEAEWMHAVRRLPSPVDREEWTMPPQMNNGTNRRYELDIILPAGLLQAPMFDPDADPSINYGAIGSYIGHEIPHGFDDQGRRVDSQGKLRDWWGKRDAHVFQARSKKLVAQYGAFAPVPEHPDVRVDGELTLGENIADLGGVATALDAYRRSLAGRTPPTLDGLTGEQRFFLGWAQAWRSKASAEFLKNQVVTDEHTPRQFRVDGVVRNLDEWYAAYDVKAGMRLYLAPQDRVKIW